MTISFLIPLVIALMAFYFYRQIQEEIAATFLMLIVLLSLFLSLLWASWMTQILILITGLGAVRYFCYRHSCQDSREED